MKITYDGVLKRDNFKSYVKSTRRLIVTEANSVMQEEVKKINEKIVKETASKLKIKRQAVLKSFKGKVYNKDKDTLPTMHFYSRVPWMGAHTNGVVINKTVLIPFSSKKLGKKTLSLLLDKLRQGKNLFKDGNILWAKNTPEFQALLRPFKAFQKNLSNKRTKKGERVNIGVLIKGVKLTKKINMEQIVKANLEKITKGIEKRFK